MVGADLSGAVLNGRYRLTSLLGAGGMGQVYAGIHLSLDRRVAVKVLPSQLSEDPRFRARFAREARAAAKINHRNVVQITDFGESPDGPVYFVMEFLEGRDLGAVIRDVGRLPWPRARNLLLQATSAIKAAHAHGIIHRDIKPGNCFVLDLPLEGLTDVVKLLDFGIAKVIEEAEKDGSMPVKPLTITGEMMGTASYMSPEQACCESLDARSDVYSLGIMAYEMLTGRVPFTGFNLVHVATRRLFDRPEPLHRAVPDILPEVEDIVLRALAKEPEQRFQSMAELEAALLAVPQEVNLESVPTRVLSAVGSAARGAMGRGASTGRPGLPTVVLHDPASRVEPGVAEDSFEDAETPDPLVLLPRFGEPCPVQPRANEEPEAPIPPEDESVGDEPPEMEEVTSARIRLVPDPPPGSTDVMVAAQESVVERMVEPVSVVARVPESWPMARPEPEAPAQSIEGAAPRRARSKTWAVAVGLVLALASAVTATKLVMSRPQTEASVGTVASVETAEQIDGLQEPVPVPMPVEVNVGPARITDGEPARTIPNEVVTKGEATRLESEQGIAPHATIPVRPEPEDPTETVADEAKRGDAAMAAPVGDGGPVEAAAARPAKPKRHETPACQEVRDRAYRAHEAGEYLQVVAAAASSPCWPSSLKLRRLKMYQNALFETRQFTQCVDVGRGIADSTVMQLTSKCQKQLQLAKTTKTTP